MHALGHLGSGSPYQALYLQECPPHPAQVWYPILDSRKSTRSGNTAQSLCTLTPDCGALRNHLSWRPHLPPAYLLLSPGLPGPFFSLTSTKQCDPITCPRRQSPTAVWGPERLALSCSFLSSSYRHFLSSPRGHFYSKSLCFLHLLNSLLSLGSQVKVSPVGFVC